MDPFDLHLYIHKRVPLRLCERLDASGSTLQEGALVCRECIRCAGERVRPEGAAATRRTGSISATVHTFANSRR